MLSVDTVKKALANVQPKTQGVRVGAEVRVGRDSTDDDAIWVYVVVPDERIDAFYQEWEEVREDIRQQVRERLGHPEVFVYIRMRAASEDTSEPPPAP